MTSSGSPISVRQMVSICFSPPDSTPAGGIGARGEVAETSRACPSSRHCRGCLAVLDAEHQVLPHRQRREDVAVLGHIAEAADARSCRAWQAGDVVALEPDGALRRHLAHDRLHGGRAADAVAAQQADHLAGADVQIDALQDVALAVIGMQIARPPASGRLLAEIGFLDFGVARISSGVPEAMIWP